MTNITDKIKGLIPLEPLDIKNHPYRTQMIDIVKNLIDNGKLYGFSNDMNTIKYFGYFKGNELITK